MERSIPTRSSLLSSQVRVYSITTCPDTPAQNGVAERKNRHLLEMTRALMFEMNVPKTLWGEAVMTAVYLISRILSRILGMKTPCEMLLGETKFVIPPKVFGSTCFVRDHNPTVGKMDPRAIKYVFVRYPFCQKGYKCWSPTEKRFFVSMDVTFRESEPYYGNPLEKTSPDWREGERSVIRGEIPLAGEGGERAGEGGERAAGGVGSEEQTAIRKNAEVEEAAEVEPVAPQRPAEIECISEDNRGCSKS